MNHLRAHMDPKSLEELLFLYFNLKELWANDVSIIDKAIAQDKREKTEVKAVTAAAAAALAADTSTVEDF